MCRVLTIVAVIVVVLMGVRSSVAGVTPAPTYAGSTLWKGIDDFKVADGYAYCISSLGLRVLDVRVPASPSFISQVAIPPLNPSGTRHLALGSGYAYVADNFDGLRVVDIHNPRYPVVVGSFPTSACAYSVAVSGSTVYLMLAGTPPLILDLSTPASPRLVDSVVTPGHVQEINVSGSHLYLVDDSAGLVVYDISSPQTPVRQGNFVDVARGMTGWTVRLSVSENLAVVESGQTVRVIDLSNPTSPHLECILTPTSGYNNANFTLVGSILYVRRSQINAPWGHETAAYDLSNPQAPRLYGVAPSNKDFAVFGSWPGYLGVFTTSSPSIEDPDEFQILDISNSKYPSSISTIPVGWSTGRLTTSGNYAYILNRVMDMLIVDISDPSNPRHVANYRPYRWPKSVLVNGRYAFIGENQGLEVVDVSNPLMPKRLTYCSLNLPFPTVDDMVLRGRYLYFVGGSGLSIVDVSVAGSPSLVGNFATPASAYSLAVSGSYAYVACYTGGLMIYDVSTPSQIELAGRIEGFECHRVQIAVDRAYVSGQTSSEWLLRVLDITEPTVPSLLGQYTWPKSNPNDVTNFMSLMGAWGNYAYLGRDFDSLEVVDLTNPATPTRAAIYPIHRSPYGFALVGQYALVSEQIALLVLGGFPCCSGTTGDIDFTGGSPDVADLTALVDYLFAGGSAFCPASMDIDGSGANADISDMTYLVDYLFTPGTPAPAMCR